MVLYAKYIEMMGFMKFWKVYFFERCYRQA
jgi:hypothetical protein